MKISGIAILAMVSLGACSAAEPPEETTDLSPVQYVAIAEEAALKAEEEAALSAEKADAVEAPAQQETAIIPVASRSEQVRNYAIILGRAAGCGMDVEPYGAPVGRWIARTTSGTEESNLTVMFMGEVVAARERQRARQTGLTCMQAVDAINDTSWPR